MVLHWRVVLPENSVLTRTVEFRPPARNFSMTCSRSSSRYFHEFDTTSSREPRGSYLGFGRRAACDLAVLSESQGSRRVRLGKRHKPLQPVRYTEDDGKEKTITDRLKLPSDVANGMTPTLLKNIRPGVTQTTLSMVAFTPKPRIVKLVISPEGEETFSTGGSSHKATRYLVKIQIGGVTGLVAPLVGKQPPDTHVWILGGDAPVFVKLEGPLYQDRPAWRIELTSPVWRND
jgi:hypothetical protein